MMESQRRRDVFRVQSGVLALGLFAITAHAQSQALPGRFQMPFSQTSAARTPLRGTGYFSLPLSFEPNRGQTSVDAQFIARGPAYSLALTPSEARFTFETVRKAATGGRAAIRPTPSLHRTSQLRMQLVNAAGKARMRGVAPLPGVVNYISGTKQTWKTDIPTFRKVSYQAVYPGIDLVYYGNQRQLEYDFIVAPNADPSRIGFRFAGASHLTIARTGDLTVSLGNGAVSWHKPVAYQDVNGKRKPVESRFVVTGKNQIGFALARYDSHRPLVIDPVFTYSTYLGGSGNDSAAAIALDRDGNAYVTGQTASSNFPGASGYPGATAGFVTKLNGSGSAAIYSTYIGQAFGQAIAVDGSGQAYVAGYTAVPGLPIVNGVQTTYNGGGSDAFLMKINAAGNGLLYSTFLGGNDFDFVQGIALGTDNTVYLGGYTLSTNFPARNAMRSNLAGGTDAFIAHIDTTQVGSASLLQSTYFGGSADDVIFGIAVDAGNRIYVTGRTSSTNFPTIAPFQASLAGQQNAFLSVLTPGGGQLSYSTYFGGSQFDVANAIAVDASQHAYIAGSTSSPNFPVRGALVPTYGGGGDAFIAKFDCSVVGNGSLLYATYIGGPQVDAANGIALDVWGNMYVTGYTYNTVTASDNSVFLLKLDPTGASLLYSTTFGGSKIDVGSAVAVDGLGHAFIAGSTTSPDFPASAGAFRRQNTGLQDAFVSRIPTFTKLDFNHDSIPDLLFQNSSDGRLVDWLMQGDRETSYSFLSPASLSLNWKVVASADLNGDGSTDLLLQDSNSGNIAYWTMSGITQIGVDFISPANPGDNWNVVGAADINRDGYTDIVLQNSVSGDIYVWYMQGTTMIGGGFITPQNPGAGWQVVAVGDLNGDGQADIVLQNSTTGNVYIWFMHGDTLVSGGFTNPANPGANFRVAGLVDVTGDGRPELFFQNTATNDIIYWVLNGLNQTRAGAPTPSNPGTGWKLVGIN